MKRRLTKLLFKLFIILSVFECIYLFILPPILHEIINGTFLNKTIQKSTNINILAQDIKIKTHITPDISIIAKDITVQNTKNNLPLFSAINTDVKLAIIPLFFKKIAPKHFYADDLEINLIQNNDGTFNFDNLSKKKSNKPFKVDFHNFKLKSTGNIIANSSPMDFDFNLKFSTPFSFKTPHKNNIKGSALLYNINLKEFSPFITKFLPQIKETDGDIEYIQISSEKQNKGTEIVVNAKFNDVIYNQTDWNNNIYAKGDNKISAAIGMYKNEYKIQHFKYNAENIDISAYGTILPTDKPELDLIAEVKNSRTEAIAAIIPPTLVKETMIFDKIKTYGVYGDINGKASIKGKVPQPDLYGTVTGRHIRILDKNTQKLHEGTVNIDLDGRKINMDIDIALPENNSAKVMGTTYIYRDGINDVKIKTTKNIDFPLAHKLVMAISKVFNFQLGPIPDMNITSGKGELDIHIRGSLDFIDLDGHCDFNNANLTYNGLYGKITNGKGSVKFKGDNIIVKSDRAFMEGNPFDVSGTVKINNHLNFDVSSNSAKASDLLKIINNSEILKEVKKGLLLFNNPDGDTALKFNISSNIVPVPFGQPPLPPEEAFVDMKVKGALTLNGVLCYLEGFNTPLEKISGIVNFTETVADFKDLYAQSGNSSINIEGKVTTDVETKIPDVNLTITGNSVKMGDTIRFLADSYLYPQNYPNISSLYNLDVKHDLFVKYNAKSIDFLTDKVYALMNIQKDTDNKPIQAQSGKIVMNNAKVEVDNIIADVFNSKVSINGTVTHVDTINPIYNIKINADRFNLENLNRSDEINILPVKMSDILSQFSNYKGYMDFLTEFKNNRLYAKAFFSDLSFLHTASSMPIIADDFTLEIKDDKLIANNVTADIAHMPVYANMIISDIYTEPYIEGHFAAKPNNGFIQTYLPSEISSKISVLGDINASADIKGTMGNLHIEPQITLYPDADAVLSGLKVGDIAEKRIFKSKINLKKDLIDVENFDYYKYITTQNNTVYPVLFANGNAKVKTDEQNGTFDVQKIHIKTEKSLSAKLLNVFLNNPLLKQGMINCDLEYYTDERTGQKKLKGDMEARNIDIPMADTILKNIKADTNDGNINVRLFGFINDSAVRVKSVFDNNLSKMPHISDLSIKADKINTNKILHTIANAKSIFENQKEQNKITDLSMFEIKNGELHIDELTVKNYNAQDINGKFSIDDKANFTLEDINIKLDEGSATGKIVYNLANTDMNAELEFKNVNSNDLAENLFDAKNQIFGNANANFLIKTRGTSDEELISNLSGFVLFNMTNGRMPKLGSLEYLLRASNIIKRGVTGFTINNVLEILNLVKTGYFSSISGNCKIEDGIAQDIEIFSQGENLSLYLHGDYNISNSNANMEILGKVSNRISTVFGPIGNTSLNTLFKHIPGISLIDFGRKDIVHNVEKIPSFTGGTYDSRTFQAIIKGDINSSGYVQSFKWVNN